MKIKCAHCQHFHQDNFECRQIKELQTFVGDDEYQAKKAEKQGRAV